MRKIIDKRQWITFGGSILAGLAVITVVQLAGGRKEAGAGVAEIPYVSEYARLVGEFSAKTTSELLQGKEMNTCYSPASMFAATTLLAETTEGDTQAELLESLGVENIAELETMYDKLQKHASIESSKTNIRLSNALWIGNSYLTEESLAVLENCEEKLGCNIYANDLVLDSSMEKWISENTNGLIEEVPDIDMSKAMSLINTLYYKAPWKYEFQRVGMKEFTLTNGDKISTEFIKCGMKQMSYKEMEDYTAVAVPMATGRMVLVLPAEDVKLDSLLSEGKLNELLAVATGSGMMEGQVLIQLPKYEINSSFKEELKDTMVNLGIRQLFGENCQWVFSDMLNQMRLDIYQSTRINVNLYGVEAAAVTKADVIPLGGSPVMNSLEITLDRPFLYILVKNESPLFIGTVYNPAE